MKAVVEYSSISSLSTNIDELNENSFNINVTNIYQTVIVDQSYPSDVDTRSKIPDNVVDSLNYFSKPLTKHLQSFFNFHPIQPLMTSRFILRRLIFEKKQI